MRYTLPTRISFYIKIEPNAQNLRKSKYCCRTTWVGLNKYLALFLSIKMYQNIDGVNIKGFI